MKYLILILVVLLCNTAYADIRDFIPIHVLEETDGSPSVRPLKVQVSPGTLTVTGRTAIIHTVSPTTLDATYLRLDSANDPMTGGLDLGANTFDTTGNATLGTISGDYLVAPSGTLSFGSSDLITTGDLTCKGVFTAGPGGAGDTVINWKTGNTIRYVMGVDDSEDDMFILAGATGFQNDNLISVDTLGAMWVAERIKFVQEDGAEQITSDTDGDLDIVAGTNIHLNIGATLEVALNATTLDAQSNNITTTGNFSSAGLTSTAGRVVATTRIDDGDSPYTILATDHLIFCDTDGGAITVNLPAGVEGTHYKIINCGSSGNDLTVDGNGAEAVWGSATMVLTDGEILDLHYNATEGWW